MNTVIHICIWLVCLIAWKDVQLNDTDSGVKQFGQEFCLGKEVVGPQQSLSQVGQWRNGLPPAIVLSEISSHGVCRKIFSPPRNSALLWVYQHPHPDNLLWDLHPVYHGMATPLEQSENCFVTLPGTSRGVKAFPHAWTILCWKEPGPLILQATDFCHSLSYLFRNYCQRVYRIPIQ